MADRNDEDILRAILEKGSDKAKKAAAEALAAQPVVTSDPPKIKEAKTKAKRKGLTKNKIAGSFYGDKYYFGPGGIIIDKDGKPAPVKVQDMLADRSAMVEQVKEQIVPKYAKNIEREINRVTESTNQLVRSHDIMLNKFDPAFQEVDKTIRTLVTQHELIVRSIIKQNQEQQDKLIEDLTGQKTATRAGGAKARAPSIKGTARPAVGASRAAAGTRVAAAYQKARVSPPKELQERYSRMQTARRERTIAALKTGGYTGFALGGIGAAAAFSLMRPSAPPTGAPPGAPRTETVPGPTGTTPSPQGTDVGGGLVKLITPISKREYTVAKDVAPNFKAFVDELENSGYQIKAIGGYRQSAMWHGKGYAIDINPDDNPMFVNRGGRIVNLLTGADASQFKDTSGRYPFGYGKDNLPADISAMAAKYGLGWGGNWRSSVDTMHFSAGPNEGGNVAGVTIPTEGAPQQTAAAMPTGAPVAAAPPTSAPPGVPQEAMAPSPGTPNAPAAATGADEHPRGKEGFMRIMQAAKAAGDPFPEVVAAQWAIESGWGRSMTGRNNPFGQTGVEGRDPGRRIPTPRDPSGGSKFFRDFNSIEEAVAFRVQKWAPKYAGAKSAYEALMMLQNYGGKPRYAEGYNNDWYSYVTSTSSVIRSMGIDPQAPSSGQTQVAQAPGAVPSVPGVPEAAMAPSPGTANAPGTPQREGSMPGGDIVALGKELQGQGIRVSEHPAFGGVEPVHRGRGHYEGRAIDVNAGMGIVEANDPVWGPKFDQIAAQAKAAGYNVIWRSAGHYNHMHIEIPSGGPTQVAQGPGPGAARMPQPGPPPNIPPQMQPQRGAGYGYGGQLASASMQTDIFGAIQQQIQMAMGGPVVINNTRMINNTRTIHAGRSNIGPRQSEGFDPLQTFGALAAGFAIGKGLRLF